MPWYLAAKLRQKEVRVVLGFSTTVGIVKLRKAKLNIGALCEPDIQASYSDSESYSGDSTKQDWESFLALCSLHAK